AQQSRYFRARLRESENVIDEQQNVLVLLVAKIFGHRETGESYAQACPGRLGHLTVYKRALRFGVVVRIDNSRLLHFKPEIVAFARALAHAREDRNTAVLHGDIVDQLLNNDGLAHAGAAEQADFSAAQIGLDQVDHLDAC